MTGAGPLFAALRQALLASEPVALVTVIGTEPGDEAGGPAGPLPALGAKLLVRPGAEPEVLGRVGSEELDRVLARDAGAALEQGVTVDRHYGRRGEARRHEVSVLIESFAPPPKLVIFGAVDFTAALAKVAKVLGYRVDVCDARPVFATRARFPMADEVVADRPERYLAAIGAELGPRDAICVLTHDPKFDVPAIISALQTKIGYLGAMGSRRTHADRVARLHEAGLGDDELARVMAPIGLDIGARTPEETAVAICAEIIACRTGKDAPSLRDRTGPIHVPASPPAVHTAAHADR